MLMNSRRNEKALGYVALLLLLCQLSAILLSWILNAAGVTMVRSLLSAQGIKWFMGSFVDNISSPLLVWLLLLSIAYGALRYSGLISVFTKDGNASRRTFALRVVIAEICVFVIVLLLLSVAPHALLLNAMGELFPSSSFSRCLVPYIAFCVCFISVSYGSLSGRYDDVADIFRSLTVGIEQSSHLLFLYILVAQLYFSVCYMLS
jgi:aminobenzoyl-glutamate transport protein